MEQRVYDGAIDPGGLADALLEEWDRDDTIAQVFGEGDRYIVQIGQREGGWFGDEPHQALTLDLEAVPEGLQVTMGQQQWFKEGGQLFVGGMIGFFPFFFTWPLGGLLGGQEIDQRFPSRVWQNIDRYVASVSPAAAPPASEGPATGRTTRLATISCAECGVANPVGAQRCSACGASLEVPSACPQCGHRNPPGANFCNRCGTKLNPAATLGAF
jgi:ribosomal protein L40E